MKIEIIKSNLDYVNEKSKIVIVGKTPGPNQINGPNHHVEDLMAIKKRNAFAGPIRKNLIKMLDYTGINKYINISSCETLWSEDYSDNVDFTSILKNAIFINDKALSTIDLKTIYGNPELKKEFEEGFLNDCLKYNQVLIWVALGKDVEDVLIRLKNLGKIKKNNIILGFPHPSGANAGRVSAYLGLLNKNEKSYQWAKEKATINREVMLGLNNSK